MYEILNYSFRILWYTLKSKAKEMTKNNEERENKVSNRIKEKFFIMFYTMILRLIIKSVFFQIDTPKLLILILIQY